MPRGSNSKRERQYEHIKASAKQRGESTGRAEEKRGSAPSRSARQQAAVAWLAGRKLILGHRRRSALELLDLVAEQRGGNG